MKTRMVYTKFWHDNYVSELTAKEKLVFIYLITNEKINLCGIYELPDKYIRFDLGLTQPELEGIKEKFMKDGKFLFIDGWVSIVNFNGYNSFAGEKNERAKQKELEQIPQKVIEYQYSIDRVSTNLDTLNNHNHNINHNHNTKEENIPYSEIIKSYNTICTDLSKVIELTPTRKNNITWRWNKFATRNDKDGNEIGIRLFEELFERTHESDFLSGRLEDKRNVKKPWKANFDWLLEEKNLVKVMEGNYDNSN